MCCHNCCLSNSNERKNHYQGWYNNIGKDVILKGRFHGGDGTGARLSQPLVKSRSDVRSILKGGLFSNPSNVLQLYFGFWQRFDPEYVTLTFRGLSAPLLLLYALKTHCSYCGFCFCLVFWQNENVTCSPEWHTKNLTPTLCARHWNRSMIDDLILPSSGVTAVESICVNGPAPSIVLARTRKSYDTEGDRHVNLIELDVVEPVVNLPSEILSPNSYSYKTISPCRCPHSGGIHS